MVEVDADEVGTVAEEAEMEVALVDADVELTVDAVVDGEQPGTGKVPLAP